MPQDTSRKFVVFDTIEGGQVAVRVDSVTYLRTRVDGDGTLIAFPGDDGVSVVGSVNDVVAALESA